MRDVERGGCSAASNQHALPKRQRWTRRDVLLIHVFLQQVLQVQGRPLFHLPGMVPKLYLTVDEKLGVRKGLAPGGEILLAHDRLDNV